MSWFKRIFGKDTEPQSVRKQVAVVPMKNLDYPPKIVLAWSKAIEGNTDLGAYLLNNGYPELFYATQAILLKPEAREWLMNNGYPHLMAMINAAEGNESALNWLKVHQFDILYHIAEAVEGQMDSFAWLKANATEDLFLLARTIKSVKDDIEFNHNDIHSFGKDL